MNNDLRGPVKPLPVSPNRPADSRDLTAQDIPEPPESLAKPQQILETSTPLPVTTSSSGVGHVPHAPRLSRRRLTGSALLGSALVFGIAITLIAHGKPQGAAADAASAVPAQTLSLSALSQALSPSEPLASSSLTVNGQLNVNGTVVISPTTKPQSAQIGELYFDQSTNTMAYYNGHSFVPIGSSSVINNVNNAVTNNNVTTTGPKTVTNVTQVTNVTNVTNTTSGSTVAGLTGSGTAGSLAMFTPTGDLAASLLTQSGTNLSTGTADQSVTLGSLSDNSSATLQGGTGNVNILTGTSTGSSGAVTIQSGDSSTTTAGNVSIDTGSSVISGTVVADKTFEDGTDNMQNAIYGDNSAVTQSTAEARTGTHSLAVTVGSDFFPSWAVGDGAGDPPFIIPAQAGHTYAFSAWVRAGTNSDTITASVVWSNDGYGGGGEISQQTFGTVTDISSGWRKVDGVLTAPVGAYALGLNFASTDAQTIGEVHYFDDITVTDLSSSSAAAALNIGATNAQVITIGNSGMLAPTTIYGGGVNVTAGSGFINFTGANIAATSGGATYGTTTGALDITSATTATWKIAASGGTGGDLNIAAGNGGGTANGGNLNLASGSAAGTGASGAINLTTPTSTASSGAIQIQSGDSSTTAAGNVSIDTGNSTVAGTVVDDLTFESGTDNMAFWGGTGTATQNCTVAHTGSCSLDISGSAGPSTWEDSGDFGFGVTPGHQYAFSFWVESGSTPTAVGGAVSWGTGSGWQWSPSPIITDTTTGWTQVSWTATAPAGAQYGDFNLSIQTSGTDQYFDDVTATDMSSGAASSELNLGTANAQGVTIGNTSQINPTTLYGGGISLQAGVGNLTLSGGTATITSATNINLSAAASAIVRPSNDSSAAFQVQSAGGAPLLVADTTHMQITVTALIVSADLTVNGHLITGGATPTIAAGPAACASPTVSIAGTDTAGTITITTGSGCSAPGKLATITFATAYAQAPRVVVAAASATAAGVGVYADNATVSTATADISAATTPAPATTYQFNYWIAQ